MMEHKKVPHRKGRKRGPKPEILKLDVDTTEGLARLLRERRPPSGPERPAKEPSTK